MTTHVTIILYQVTLTPMSEEISVNGRTDSARTAGRPEYVSSCLLLLVQPGVTVGPNTIVRRLGLTSHIPS